MNDPVNVLTLKWGDRYSAEYVNRIYRGVRVHLHRPFRFVCVTDRPAGLLPEIETDSIPPRPPEMKNLYTYEKNGWPNIFLKLLVFKPGFANLSGPTLFLDIDQIITGDLDRFFDYKPGEFCIIRNWVELRKRLFRKVRPCGNSSCFRFDAGERYDYVYRLFLKEIDAALDDRVWSTEQEYMTHAVGLDKVNFWPESYVRSFKRSCTWPWPLNHFLVPRLPADTSILCFHGKPDPDQAIAGFRGRHLNTWTRPCPWVKELWEGL